MKHFIKNLLMPFAVVAMLSVGVFTMNASNKTEVTVVNEDPEIQTPYEGDLYYLVEDTFEKANINISKQCSFDNSSGIEYYELVPAVNRQEQMYGWDLSRAEHLPLYLITQQ